MKKFSVLLVAILALMMLFVSCENEPKERVATMKDAKIVMGLVSFVYDHPDKAETVDYSKFNSDKHEGTITFNKAVFKEDDNIVAVLDGTATIKKDQKTTTNSVDFGDGTKYKGVDHTLVANMVMDNETGDVVSYEIMLDGVILTDFVFDLFSI